jgi:hypothetical protein
MGKGEQTKEIEREKRRRSRRKGKKMRKNEGGA